MAKLRAHGYEVARIHAYLPGDKGTSSRETVLSFRSDGHVLRKEIATFKGGALDGARYDWGWKLYRRYSDRNITPDRIATAATRWANRVEDAGLRVDRKGC